MKSVRYLTVFFAVMLFAVVTPPTLAESQPNIIFILADDLGWAEPGCYGNDFNETPHVDRLAREGVRFTQAYAAAPVCSPYRASLLTGQYPIRHGILDYLRPDTDQPLSTDHVTFPELLQANGYRTGFIGKWHLSGYRYHGAKVVHRATEHGYDEEIATEIKGVGNGANFWPYVFRTQPIGWTSIKTNRLGDEEYLVDRMNLEACDFIERHHRRPFFLMLSHFATHSILKGKKSVVEKYRRKHAPGPSERDKCYICQDAGLKGDPMNHWASHHNPHLAAMLESIDDGVGMILEKLKDLQIDDNTILVFTSDNGGEDNVTTNGALRGGKSQLYEGGIRVPLVVRWPEKAPANQICDHITSNVDFYPTLLEVAKIPPDPRQKLDGQSLLKQLRDPQLQAAERAIAWYYPLQKPHFLGGRSSCAIRKGDWKLIEYFDTGEKELFHLGTDIGEATNLAAANAQRVAELSKELAEWRQTTTGTRDLP